VHADGVLIGVVLALPERGASRAGVDRILATVIDFAALAGGVFGTALLRTARRDAARKAFLQIADAREFNIVYQPIVDLTDGAVAGYEALARFDSGATPLQVFTDATLAGAGHRLELTALQEAIERACDLPPDAWLSVNLSPSVVTEEDVGGFLDEIGDRQLVLELSELEPVSDYRSLRERIAGLGRNVMLSVDDAGSGFASLAHILALNAHYVKLDQSWVRNVDTDPAKRALVAGIQNFATETGAMVIAEGIETEAELATIKRLGIALGQGFLLGRPAVP
jgi:EAL domain-containing protein (putative c-di-GMP-specific phosphodiesterase class I)